MKRAMGRCGLVVMLVGVSVVLYLAMGYRGAELVWMTLTGMGITAALVAAVALGVVLIDWADL